MMQQQLQEALRNLADDPVCDGEQDESDSVNESTRAVGEITAGDPEVRLIQRALDVIGSPDRMARWMQSPNRSLQRRTPYSLLETEDGRRQVETVLGQIEHGIY